MQTMTEKDKASFREELGKLVDKRIRSELRKRGVKETRFDKLVKDPIFCSIHLTGPIDKLVTAPDAVLAHCKR